MNEQLKIREERLNLQEKKLDKLEEALRNKLNVRDEDD